MINLWPFNTTVGGQAGALVGAYTRLGRFSGAVLVARGGRALLAKGYGRASHEHAAPNTPRTRFPIGSQTKAFTAIAILQLQEQGKLNVGDPIATYLPGYPNGERITIHHLLTNTSGIPDYIATETFSREMALPHTLDELIARFRDRLMVELRSRLARQPSRSPSTGPATPSSRGAWHRRLNAEW